MVEGDFLNSQLFVVSCLLPVCVGVKPNTSGVFSPMGN